MFLRLVADSFGRRPRHKLIVTPQADSLPLEIGGVDYRPVNAGAYLPESDLHKLKAIFWHNNIMAFAPVLEVRAKALSFAREGDQHAPGNWIEGVPVIGTWAE